MREAQEIKRRDFALVSLGLVERAAPECHQARLLRVQAQAILRKPLRQHLQHLLRIVVALAGKTTLFNSVSGLVPPSSGRLRFRDMDLRHQPQHARARLGIGRTFQIPPPLHSLSVRENLIVARRFGAGRADRNGIDDILAVVGLTAKAERKADSELALTELKALEVARAPRRSPPTRGCCCSTRCWRASNHTRNETSATCCAACTSAIASRARTARGRLRSCAPSWACCRSLTERSACADSRSPACQPGGWCSLACARAGRTDGVSRALRRGEPSAGRLSESPACGCHATPGAGLRFVSTPRRAPAAAR